MRHSLYNGSGSMTPLQNEIEFLRQYISLMELRFGGHVLAFGATGSECGFDCDNNTFLINGGTVIGFGGNNISTPSTSSKQPVLIMSCNIAQGSTYTLGNLSFVTPATYNNATALLSDPSFGIGSTVSTTPAEADQGVGMLEPSKKTSAPLSKVTGNDLRETGCMTLLEALSGMMLGVEIYDNDEGIQHVSIRGSRSQNGNVVPLYIVDGHEVPHLMNISIDQVKDVEVLKDAALYGVKGANGAVIIHLIR